MSNRHGIKHNNGKGLKHAHNGIEQTADGLWCWHCCKSSEGGFLSRSEAFESLWHVHFKHPYEIFDTHGIQFQHANLRRYRLKVGV